MIRRMIKKEAEGDIVWIDEECVGYKCECGKVIVVDIYDDPCNKCPKCGKQYILHQTNIVFECKQPKKGKRVVEI